MSTAPATRAFVLTDNPRVYHGVRAAFRDSALRECRFYCSPSSGRMFEADIAAGDVEPIDLRTAWTGLTDFGMGFSCHSRQIFPARLVEAVRCVNVHPGLNPHNRGWYPQVFSLINKRPAGITIHDMDAEVDHGPIICQERVDVTDWDTSGTLYNRLVEREISLFVEWLPRLLEGKYRTVSPDHEGNYNDKADFEALKEIDLDRTLTFREAIDFLRAMSHPPYFNAFYEGTEGKVWVRLETKHASATASVKADLP